MKMKKMMNAAIASRYFSFFITVFLFLVLYGVGMMNFRGFTRPQVFFNLFIDSSPEMKSSFG